MDFTPRKAEKKRVKLKMAVQGPSGSGKTWGALSLAKNLWPESKICLIDTENESASLYADSFEFDTIPLHPPFHTDSYIAAINAAVKGGYDVVIIDTITHQWDGDGGILRRKEEMDRRGGNSFTNFATFTPEHERFKNAILQSPIHVIATMRSKQEYALQANDKGKQTPVKIGMAPIQRDGMDYEFTIAFDVQANHYATASKDRTSLFIDKTVNLADPSTAEALRSWLESGKAIDVSLPIQPASGAGPASQAVNTTAPTRQPPQRPRVHQLLGDDQILCEPVAVEVKEKDGKKRCIVKLQQKIHGQVYLGCFDTKLFDALLLCKDEECTLRYQVKGDFVNIVDVLQIGDHDYKDGKPYDEQNQEVEGEPVDIPF